MKYHFESSGEASTEVIPTNWECSMQCSLYSWVWSIFYLLSGQGHYNLIFIQKRHFLLWCIFLPKNKFEQVERSIYSIQSRIEKSSSRRSSSSSSLCFGALSRLILPSKLRKESSDVQPLDFATIHFLVTILSSMRLLDSTAWYNKNLMAASWCPLNLTLFCAILSTKKHEFIQGQAYHIWSQ